MSVRAHILIAVIGMLLDPSTSFAEEVRNADVKSQEVISITKETSEQIISDYAEKEKWCDRPIPKVKSGEVIIYWTRDSSGKCIQQNTVSEQ